MRNTHPRYISERLVYDSSEAASKLFPLSDSSHQQHELNPDLPKSAKKKIFKIPHVHYNATDVTCFKKLTYRASTASSLSSSPHRKIQLNKPRTSLVRMLQYQLPYRRRVFKYHTFYLTPCECHVPKFFLYQRRKEYPVTTRNGILRRNNAIAYMETNITCVRSVLTHRL